MEGLIEPEVVMGLLMETVLEEAGLEVERGLDEETGLELKAE